MIVTEDEARAYVAGMTDSAGMARLATLAAMVLDENQRQNLIARATEPHIWQRHIADSAQLLENVSRETLGANAGGPWLDLGSGPGFPGLVIAALCPNMPVVLVESRARRVEFLKCAIAAMDLPKCRVEGQRLERVEAVGPSPEGHAGRGQLRTLPSGPSAVRQPAPQVRHQRPLG